MKLLSQLCPVIASLVFLGLAGPAQSATKIWTGASSSDWFSADNWTPAGVPSSGDIISVDGTVSLSSPVTISGTLNWTGGGLQAGNLIIAATGVMNISGDTDKTLYQVNLDNSGIVNWSGKGQLVAYFNNHDQAVLITNLAAGVLNIQTDANIVFQQADSWNDRFLIQNEGIFRKTGGSGTNTFAPSTWHLIQFNNAGRMEIQRGALNFPNGFGSTGTILLATNTVINLTGGTLNLGPDNQLPGPGRFVIPNGASVTVNGTVRNLSLNGGQLSGSSTVIDTLDWTDGWVRDGSLTIASNAVLNLGGSAAKMLYRVSLTNMGTVNWAGTGPLVGYYDYHDQAVVIANRTAGLFNIQTDANIVFQQADSWNDRFLIQNEGIFRKTGGSGTNTLAPSSWRAIQFINTGQFQIQQGSLNFPSGFSSSGTIDLATNATLNLTGGTVTLTPDNQWLGEGKLVIPTNAAVTLNGTVKHLVLDGGELVGDTAVFGRFDWNGGWLESGSLDVATNGILNINAPEQISLYRYRLTNHGTVNWLGAGALRGYFNNHDQEVAIDNAPGALFNLGTDADIIFSQGEAWNDRFVFNNAGTLRKTAGSGTNTFVSSTWHLIEFNNTGRVEIQRGALNFPNGFSSTGTILLAADTVVNLTGGTLNLGPDNQLPGAGRFVIPNGASVTVNGVVNNLTLNNGQLIGATTITSTFDWNGGWLRDGSLSIAAGAVLNLSGPADKIICRAALANAGTVNWSGTGRLIGYFDGHDQVVAITNAPGALFNLGTDADIIFSQGDAWNDRFLFNNSGTLRKTDGPGTNTFVPSFWHLIEFNNEGRMEIQRGALNFPKGFSSTGTILLATNTVINLTGGTLNLGPDNQLPGPGRFVIPNGASVTVNGTVRNLSLNGGQLSGASTMIDTLDWTDGWVRDGSLTIASNAVLNLSGSAAKMLYRVSLTNMGTVNWAGTGPLVGYYDYHDQAVVIANRTAGLFNIQTDANIVFQQADSWNDRFLIQNEGIFRKTGGSGTNTLAPSSWRAIQFINTGLLQIQQGSLNFPSGFSSSGTIDLATNATLNLTGGTVTLTPDNQWLGEGNLVIPTNAAVTLNGTVKHLVLDGGELVGDTAVFGRFDWNGGWLESGSLDVATNGILNINAPAQISLYRYRLTNHGTVNWLGAGALRGYFNNHDQEVAIDNAPGALFNLGTDADIIFSQGDAWNDRFVFNNAGTLRKTDGPGTNTFIPSTWHLIEFNNTGRVEIQRGALNFPNGFSSTGTILLAADTVVNLTGGTLNLGPDNQLPGPGRFVIPNGANVTVNGVVNNLTLNNGQLIGAATITSTFDWNGGWLRDGSLSIAAGAVLNLNGPEDKIIYRAALANAGTVNWSGTGRLIGYFDGHDQNVSIVNQKGGVFFVKTDANIVFSQADSWNDYFAFNNAGLLIKLAATGTNSFVPSNWRAIAFDNSGLVQIEQSGLIFPNGFTSSGTIDMDMQSAIYLTGGTVTFATNSHEPGAGCFVIPSSASVTINGAVSHLILDQGSLSGNATVTGSMEWTGGWVHDGQLAIATNAFLTITGDADKTLCRVTLNNAGAATWSGQGNLVGYYDNHNQNVTIANLPEGVFNVQTDRNIVFNQADNWNDQFSFDNAGLLRKTAGTNATLLVSSNWRSIDFLNRGTVEIDSGTLRTMGNYTADTNSVLITIIGGPLPGVSYGQLWVDGRATLAGKLEVRLANNFMPAIDALFTNVVAGQINGVFANTNAMILGGLRSFIPQYTPNWVQLQTRSEPAAPARVQLINTASRQGNIQFQVIGEAGWNCTIQASDNLKGWSTLLITNIVSVPFQFAEPIVPGVDHRFYRVILTP